MRIYYRLCVVLLLFVGTGLAQQDYCGKGYEYKRDADGIGTCQKIKYVQTTQYIIPMGTYSDLTVDERIHYLEKTMHTMIQLLLSMDKSINQLQTDLPVKFVPMPGRKGQYTIEENPKHPEGKQ